jgi:NADPH-dependent dioxygenase
MAASGTDRQSHTRHGRTVAEPHPGPSSRPDRTPVVIVGAGPTGVMLAIELARRGVEVRVLDKLPCRPQESRALAIHARTLEMFDQLGMIEEFLELGHRVDEVVFHTRARRETQARFAKLDSPTRFCSY